MTDAELDAIEKSATATPEVLAMLFGALREYRANAQRSQETAQKAVAMLEGNQARALRALDEFERMNGRGLPCGHTFGDLTYAPFAVTKCGACVQSRQAEREGKAT